MVQRRAWGKGLPMGLMVAAAIVVGCQGSPKHAVHADLGEGPRPDKVMKQFFEDNTPGSVGIGVSVWRAEPPGLIIQMDTEERIFHALIEDTHWVEKDPDVSVAGIEILLTLEIGGPCYSLKIRLPRNLGSFTMGALANEFTNPRLARILKEVCEENHLFEGYEGRVLKDNLMAAGGLLTDLDGPPTAEEQEQMDQDVERREYAYEMSREEMIFLNRVLELHRAGGDIDAWYRESDDGESLTPLQWAATNGWRMALDRLLVYGAKVDAPSSLGRSALDLAVKRGDWGCAMSLILAGADPNKKPGQSGWTALHWAVMWYQDAGLHRCVRDRIIEILLKAGADPQQKNAAGKSPLDLAREKQLVEVVRLMMRYAGG